MEDQLKSYRQPLVTATGIILGFVLNFASEFVETDTQNGSTAYIIGICILIGVAIQYAGVLLVLTFTSD